MKINRNSKSYKLGYWAGVALIGVLMGVFVFYLLQFVGLIESTPQYISVNVVEATNQPITVIEPDPVVEVVEPDPEPIDYFEVIVSSTFRHETGNGSSPLWESFHNAGGIRCFTSADQCTSDGFQIYESKEHGMSSLRYHMELYVSKYGYDLQAIRAEYCGACADSDLIEFTAIYQEEIEKWTQ